MSITLGFSPSMLERLHKYSQSTGKSINDCVEKAVESYLNLTSMTFDTFLAPLRKQVAESGMSTEEVDDLLQKAIDETRVEQNSKVR